MNRIISRIFVGLSLVCLSIFHTSAKSQEIGVAGTGLSEAIGLNQEVAVVMCEYLGDDTEFTATEPGDSGPTTFTVEDTEQLAELMDDRVNPFYLEATAQPSTGQGITSFEFIPVAGKCQFDYENNGIEDDPETMNRELIDAMIYADEATPNIFNTTSRIIVVVNAKKRARGTWAHWPVVLPNSGLTMLRGAVIGLEDVAEADYSTIAHELGHQLGLPDLYQLDGESGQLVGRWGQMGFDELQNFTSYSRFLAGWIESPASRVIDVTSSTLPTAPIRLDVPGNTNGNPELIRIDASPDEASTLSGAAGTFVGGLFPFIGYYIEVRNPTTENLDNNLPGSYAGGVVIYRHTDWLNSETGFAPRPLTVMHPTQSPPASDVSTAARQELSPPFIDASLGLIVSIPSRNADGSYNISISWTPPPRPDIVVTDLLLDAPQNGFGNVVVPELFGDPVFNNVSISVTAFPPSVSTSITTPAHTMVMRVSNVGTGANSAGLSGSLWLLNPVVPIPFDINDLASLLPLRIAELPFSVPSLLPGASITVPLPLTPPGHFLAVAFIHENPQETDLALLNNAYFEPFLAVPVLSAASPYPPLDLDMPVVNIDGKPRMVAFSMNLPQPLPNGWTYKSLDNARMFLAPGEGDKFHVRIEPPSPDIIKPGGLGVVDTTAWMHAGDSFIPVMSLPRYVQFKQTTATNLEAKGADTKFNLSGKLVSIQDGQAIDQLAGKPIILALSRESGPDITFNLVTDNLGRFSQTLVLQNANEIHAAIAHFVGSPQFDESVSNPIILNKSAVSKPMLKALNIVMKDRKLLLTVELTSKASSDIKIAVSSSHPKLAKAASLVVKQGSTSAYTEIIRTPSLLAEAISFVVKLNGSTLTAALPKQRPGLFADRMNSR